MSRRKRPKTGKFPHISANNALIAAGLVGYCAIIAGIWRLAGIGWALVGAGAMAVTVAVLLYDPTPKTEPLPREYTTGQRPLRQVDK